MTQAKHKPQTGKHGNRIVVPYNIRAVTQQTEDGTEETFYQYGEIRIDRQDPPPLSAIKDAVVQRLRAEQKAHIYQHYEKGTQSTIGALQAKAARLGRTDVQDECEAVFNWIEQVLDYYDEKKQAILDAVDEAGVTGVNWDFTESVPKPDIKGWREIKAMF